MNHAVRCPKCSGLSRVGGGDLGGPVACPHCGEAFLASEEVPSQPPVPVLRPVRRPRRPAGPVARPSEGRHIGVPVGPTGPSPALIGLALLPWLIPLVWLAGPFLANREPLFTLAIPTALALGFSGLGLGVCYADGWTHGTRVKGVLVMFLLGCFSAGFLYFLKKEWLEAARRSVRRSDAEWADFDPPGKEYKVQMPAPVREAATPVPDWPLSAYSFVEPHVGAPDVFIVAHGSTAPARNDAWFAAVREAATARGEVIVEREVAVPGAPGEPGREFEVGLADGVTNRVVRAYKVGGRVYYLAAEGPFWRSDTPDVRKFLDSFEITGTKRR